MKSFFRAMKKLLFATIGLVLLVSSQNVYSQKYLSKTHNASSELKYLDENQAEEYIDFEARHNRGRVQIKWTSTGEKTNNTFHILRGDVVDNGNIKWDIIATIDNAEKSKKKFSYVDGNGASNIYYRLMVVDEAEDIQYTSIFKVVSANG